VATGGHSDAEAAKIDLLPPLHGVAAAEAEMGDEVFDSAGDDDLGSPAAEAPGGANDAAERGDVEVVHVGVGDEDEIDGGHLFDEEAGAALAAKDDEAGGEDGVDEYVAGADLKKEGGVSDEGDAEFRGSDDLGPTGLAEEGVLVALLNDAKELTYLTDGEGTFFPEFFYVTWHGAHIDSRCE
jgi:hypothetical protein